MDTDTPIEMSSDLALALMTYVPRWVYERLARPQPVRPGYSERFEAAVLFCDLAGFTALTEALAAGEEAGEKGKGVEQLQNVLSRLFTALIDVAYDYGGDVVRFSGDALTVTFGAPDCGEPRAARIQRALACALDMQRAIAPLASFQLGGVPYPLQLKIGLGDGPVLAAMVGHPQHGQDMLLTGPALAAATTCEKQAGRGDIVLDLDTWQRAGLEWPSSVADAPTTSAATTDTSERDGSFIILHPGDPGLPHLALPTAARHADLWDVEPEPIGQELVAFVPGPIVERLRMKVGELLPEFKPVTAMFAAFSGPDYANDPQAAAKVQHYVSTAQEVIAYYKGRLVEVEAGDKGSLLIVAFGAPLTDERDAIHAAQCAIAFKELPGTLRIGLSSGRVLAGTVGAPLRKRYTTIGAAVNRAARLMQTALPGQALADQNTLALSSRAIAYTSLPPVKLKGIAEPVAIYSVDGEVSDEVARVGGRLVGRKSELAHLMRALEAAWDGQAQLISLEGEAGVGKSRLALEFGRRAQQAGWRVFTGVCQSTGTQTPYLPWGALLRGILELPAEPSPEAQTVSLAQAVRAINARALERLPLLGPLLRLPIPDNDLTRHLDARLRRDGAFALVSEIMRARLAVSPPPTDISAPPPSSQAWPLMLVLEDAHWADLLSLEMAAHLARELSHERLIILLVQRPLAAPRPLAVNALRQLPSHTLIHLGPLPAEQGPELACVAMGVTTLPPEIERLVQERGQGNPFFIEEIARTVRESGVVTRNPDSGELSVIGDLNLIQIPDSIEQVVQARIDQLVEQSRLTLKVSSVIGQEFQYPVLRGIYPATVAVDEPSLHRYLDDLEQRDLTQLELPEPVLVYIFKHIITREVAYGSLLFAQRHALHEAVAHWYEKNYASNLSPHYTTLAYHYEHTENYVRQLEYFTKAGQQAAQEYANEAAREFFNKALAAAARVPEANVHRLAAIREGLGDLCGLAGEFDDAYFHYQQAHIALATQPAEETYLPLARLHRKMGRVREQQGDIPAAFEHVESGLKLLEPHREETDAAQELARLHVQESLTHTRQGNLDQALSQATQALQAAQKYDFPAELAQINNLFGVIHSMRGNNQLAAKYGQQSAILYERLGDKMGAAKAYSNLGAAHSHECNWNASLEHYQRSLYLRREIGDVTGLGFVYNNLGNVYLWQGADLENAVSALKQAEQIGLDSGRHQITLGAQASLGETYLRMGNISLAAESIQKGLALAEKTGVVNLSPHLSRLWAETLLLQQKFDASAEWAQRALQLAEEQHQRDVAGEAWCTIGRLRCQCGQLDEAQAALEQSHTILQKLRLQRQLGQTLLEMAHLRLKQARMEEAHQALNEAIEIFGRADAQWDLAQARKLEQRIP